MGDGVISIELETPHNFLLMDTMYIPPWHLLAAQQGAVTAADMEEGDTFALHDRNCIAQEWSATSRKVFVTRHDVKYVMVHDTEGRLIDDPSNFTPGGVQPFFSTGDGNSFTEEWDATDPEGSYYFAPQHDSTGPAATMNTIIDTIADDSVGLDALPMVARPGRGAPTAGEADEEGLAASMSISVTPLSSPAPSTPRSSIRSERHDGGSQLSPPALLETTRLEDRMQPRTRVLAWHPNGLAETDYKATVYMRKQVPGSYDALAVVFDDRELSPQYVKYDLSPEFIATLTKTGFLSDTDDCPVSERCVAYMPSRCSKTVEGVFYGQFYNGLNNSLLAPTEYHAVPSTGPRYPTSFHQGVEVKVPGRNETYIFLQFLITVTDQARHFALLGNPAALVASPTLLHRYFIVGMKTGAAATFEVVNPLVDCDPAILARLKDGIDAFLADIAACQLKNKEFGLPKVSQSTPLPPTVSLQIHSASISVCRCLTRRTRLAFATDRFK